jgi:predicted DNA-binding protein YlxM (UPF0122 family)
MKKPCSKCKILAEQKSYRLCKRCEDFANQDYVYLNELPVPIVEYNNHDRNHFCKVDLQSKSKQLGKKRIPKLSTLLRGRFFTASQKQVLRMHFEKNLNFSQIAQVLGITEVAIRKRLDGALKKVKKYFGLFLLVREKDFHRPSKPSSTSLQTANPSPHGKIRHYKPGSDGKLVLIEEIDPNLFPEDRIQSVKPDQLNKRFIHPFCSRCENKLTFLDPCFAYCMECNWVSDPVSTGDENEQ